MTHITEQIEKLIKELPDKCTLVAVSKTKSVALIKKAYETGHLDFGENKTQELVGKANELPKDIRWHMIGHLQRNKVKYIAPFVHLIHSVDSIRLLKEIDKQGAKYDRKIKCLLQVHIADEETKFGFDETEIIELMQSEARAPMKNVELAGLMGIATNTDDDSKIRREFGLLKQLFDRYTQFQILSMGMSGDFQIALEEGSNMVRVGSAIFGARSYPG